MVVSYTHPINTTSVAYLSWWHLAHPDSDLDLETDLEEGADVKVFLIDHKGGIVYRLFYSIS
jgi:hypothetical protein